MTRTTQLESPMLAVLPFANLSGDSAQDYFADGVVEDIITALSRFKSLIVTARNVSFAYRDQAADLAQTARALGMLYLVQGSVRRMANRLRITIHEGNLHHRGRSGKELVPTAWRGRGRDGPYPQEAVATAIPTFHFGPEEMVTDRLRLLSAALKDLGIRDGQKTGLWADKRAENSHQPSRRGEWAIPADANTSEVRIRPTLSS